MSSSFWNGNFSFNGITNEDMGVCIVDFNNSKDKLKEIDSEYSITLSEETSYNGNIFYKEENKNDGIITLELCKLDRTSWEVNDILTINNWLFTDNFCKFQTEDYNSEYNIVLYLKAIGMSKTLSPSNQGILTVKFQKYDSYARIIPDNNFTISNGGTGTLVNYSNLDKNYKPIIKVKNLGDTTTVIKITNTTTNKELELEGLNSNEEVIIDCQMATVSNNNFNRFQVLNNYNFITLAQGNNTIKLTGNAEVEFICEFPVIL